MIFEGRIVNELTESVKRAEESAAEKALIELRGSRCSCGNHKREMHSFCHYCYVKLPGSLRPRLRWPPRGSQSHMRTPRGMHRPWPGIVRLTC